MEQLGSESGRQPNEVNIHDIPPPSNKPEAVREMLVELSEDEVRRMLPGLQVDLARCLGCSPDDIRVEFGGESKE